MNPVIHTPGMGQIIPLLSFYKDSFGVKVYMPVNKETKLKASTQNLDQQALKTSSCLHSKISE